jgi:RNA polymerase sigma-70 factor (ECF subfamily)
VTSDGLAALIEPHIPALRRYAYALTRDHARADDLVQDALERVLGRWHLRRDGGDLRAWMFAILHNRFIDDRRRDRSGSRADAWHEGDGATAPEQDSALLRRDMLNALGGLSVDQRAVLLLVGVEGMSYEAAGRVLGIPSGTVMSRLSRARDRFRGLLDGERRPLLRRVK